MTRKWADRVLVALLLVITSAPNVMGRSNAPSKPDNDGAVVEKRIGTRVGKLEEAAKEAAVAVIDRAAQAG